MKEKFQVNLNLTIDTPSSMDFADTYEGLKYPWYKFESDEDGNIFLNANSDGFEHLARYFLKMARTHKNIGYHAHHSLELGGDSFSPELTVIYSEAPPIEGIE